MAAAAEVILSPQLKHFVLQEELMNQDREDIDWAKLKLIVSKFKKVKITKFERNIQY